MSVRGVLKSKGTRRMSSPCRSCCLITTLDRIRRSESTQAAPVSSALDSSASILKAREVVEWLLRWRAGRRGLRQGEELDDATQRRRPGSRGGTESRRRRVCRPSEQELLELAILAWGRCSLEIGRVMVEREVPNSASEVRSAHSRVSGAS
jgi:hypothetical protein